MSRSVLLVALGVAVAAALLIAPVTFFVFALARPPLAAAATAYVSSAGCSGTAAHGLPQPLRPIPDPLRNGAPCAVAGAMVTEKDTISQGVAGLTRYVLGLRTDAGAEYLATLDGDAAAALWNSAQAGDRVLIQTFRGRAVLVGDGTRTVPTDANPSSAAQNSAVDLWISSGLSALELLAVGMFAIWRRRSAASS
ncbi:MAG TPA: hypothetical protein VII69_02300 [Candidatus Eremiobacteraceae bacterium]